MLGQNSHLICRHNRMIGLLLLMSLVLQLGAGRCGCLEHNAWVQMVSGHAHDDDHVINQDQLASGFHLVLAQLSEDHQCTGLPPVYLNDFRPLEAAASPFHTAVGDQLGCNGTCRNRSVLLASDCRSPNSCGTLSRSALQVYLI
jgi:hypothetical protein